MVHLLQCSSSSSLHILFLFLFYTFLLTSSMEAACFSDATGRSSSPLRLQPEDTGGGTDKLAVAAENNNKQDQAAAARSIVRGETTTEGRWRRRALIGSRPPRCERVCMSCGHCEAVQVPVVPQEEMEIKAKAARSRASSAAATGLTAAMFTYRVDGIANYKPLSWKCRCGGTILDP